MKVLFFAVVALIIVFFGLQSCKNNAVEPVVSANLILNPFFEVNGVSSMEYWGPCTCSFVGEHTFSTDVPPGGGGFSFVMYPDSLHNGGIYVSKAPAPVGTHKFAYSVWAKGGEGAALFNVYRGTDTVSPTQFAYIQIPDTLPIQFFPGPWRQSTFLTDTITNSLGDSLEAGLNVDAGYLYDTTNRRWDYGDTIYFNDPQITVAQ